jgi:hypothetical protein
VGFQFGTGDYESDRVLFGYANSGSGDDPRAGLRAPGGSIVYGAAGVAYALNTTYLVLFEITNVAGPGNLNLWILTGEQFAHFKAGGLTVGELDAATQGTGTENVLGKVSTTHSGALPIVNTKNLIVRQSANDSGTFRYDEIRLGTTLDDVTPVPSPPTISVHPASQSVAVGETATFSVTAGGTAPLTYQWRADEVAIDGATAASYTTPVTTIDDDGTGFDVVVANAQGSVTSTVATLTVTESQPPSISVQPASQSVAIGETATFSVTAGGTQPFTYQWRADEVDIGGATAASYTTPVTTIDDDGTGFDVVVVNAHGSVTSAVATLTVTNPLPSVSITSPADGATVWAGTNLAILATASDAQGVTTVRFYRDTTLIGEDTTEPYSNVWENVPAGSYTLTAKAVDTLGATGTSVGVSITVKVEGGVQPSEPVALWAFDDGSGATVADGIGENDGTVVGTAPAWVAGKIGGALDINDSGAKNNYVQVPDFNYGGGDITIAYWFKVLGTENENTAYYCGHLYHGGNATGIDMYQWGPTSGSNAGLLREYNKGSSASNYGDNTLDDGNWHHIVVVFEWGVGQTFYVDGSYFSDNAGGSAISDPTGDLYFGMRSGADTGYAGSFDEIAVWNSALTPDNVEWLWNSGTGNTLVPAEAPTISDQPDSQSVVVGQTATFSVTAAGTAPLTYQWRADEVAIDGATAASYTTAEVTLGDNGTGFDVVVANAAGSVTSSVATLTVTAAEAPTISDQPDSQSVAAGETATFSVTAGGTAPLTYQWRADEVAIDGATAASYTTAEVTVDDDGTGFDVVVANAYGSVTSDVATLTVTGPEAPTISVQPVDQTVAIGETATFSVTAGGTPPFTYQWRADEVAIGGATDASYTTPVTTIGDDGTGFDVVVANAAGSVTSLVATLTVTNPLPSVSITSPADGATVAAGADLTILATASDAQGVDVVRFYRDAVLLGEDTTEPYSHVWESVPEGSYTLSAKAVDMLGATGTSVGVSITVADIRPPEPVALWAFDDGDGATVADVVGAYDGTVGGSASAWVMGKFGGALDLNESSSDGDAVVNYVTVPDFYYGGGGITISYWFKVSSGENGSATYYSGHLYHGGNLSGVDMYQYGPGFGTVGDRGKLREYNKGSTGATFTGSLYDGNWHNVVAVFTPGVGQTIYVDGSAALSNSGGSAIDNPTGDLYFGYRPVNKSGYPGSFDEIAVWNSALTADNVEWLWNSGAGNSLVPPEAPTISVHPASQSVAVGATATFSVTAAGTAPLTYQWRADEVAIDGASASSYTTAEVAEEDDGTEFDVVVANAYGSVTSLVATLTVTGPEAPTISVQPADQTVAIGETATFSVTAGGTPPFTYQWRADEVDIADATASSYTTPVTTIADNGTGFDVVVVNAQGSVTSDVATLTVTNPPPSVSITSPADGTTVWAGSSLTIEATASDAQGIATVRFYRDSTYLGQDTTEPYSLVWNSVPGGSYTLVAEAEDTLGATRTSAGVDITVRVEGGLRPAEPMALWHFNDGSGTTVLDGVGGRNGTIVGTEATWVRGKFGGALDFNDPGTAANYVQVPDFSYGGGGITISYWFKVTAGEDDNDGYYYGHLYHGGNATGIEMYQCGPAFNAPTADVGKLRENNKGTTPSNFGGNLADGNWHHVAAVFTPGVGQTIYVDGAVALSNSGGSAIDNPTGDLYFGLRVGSPTSYGYPGSFDEIALWNSALTADNVAWIWNEGAGNSFLPPEGTVIIIR